MGPCFEGGELWRFDGVYEDSGLGAYYWTIGSTLDELLE